MYTLTIIIVSTLCPCTHIQPALLANAAEDPPIPHSHENSAPPIPPRRRVCLSHSVL